jgi:hypothetical protein
MFQSRRCRPVDLSPSFERSGTLRPLPAVSPLLLPSTGSPGGSLRSRPPQFSDRGAEARSALAPAQRFRSRLRQPDGRSSGRGRQRTHGGRQGGVPSLNPSAPSRRTRSASVGCSARRPARTRARPLALKVAMVSAPPCCALRAGPALPRRSVAPSGGANRLCSRGSQAPQPLPVPSFRAPPP